MLTYDDVLALGELDAEEVEAIAEHEHIPAICAAELRAVLRHFVQSHPHHDPRASS